MNQLRWIKIKELPLETLAGPCFYKVKSLKTTLNKESHPSILLSNGNIIGDQQINLVRRKTAVGEIAANTDGDLAKNIAVGLSLPALNPDNIFCSRAMSGCLAGR